MWCRWSALAVAACGRLNFDEATPTPEARLDITVLAGQPDGSDRPIADAIVLLDDDTVEHTDVDGRVSIAATSRRSFHVIHPIATGYRVTSFVDIAAGAIEVGARSFSNRSRVPYTINFPLIPEATRYQFATTTRCAQRDVIETTASPFNLEISVQCLGEPLTGVATALMTTTPINGSTVDFTPRVEGSVELAWAPLASPTTLTVSELPADTESMTLHAYAVAGADVTDTGGTALTAPFALPITANLPMRAPPTNLGVFAVQTGGLQTTSQNLPSLAADGADLLPYATSQVVLSTRTVTWQPLAGVDLQRLELLPGPQPQGTEWIVYAPPELGTIAFPTLPAEVADADPGAAPPWVRPLSIAIDVVDADRDQLVGTLDRDWLFWNIWDERLPPLGFRASGSTMMVLP